MMRRFILTLEILFVSLFLLGGSFPETEAARNTSGRFSWKDAGPLHMLWEVWTERIT